MTPLARELEPDSASTRPPKSTAANRILSFPHSDFKNFSRGLLLREPLQAMNPRRTEHQADSRTEQSAYQPGLKNMPDTLTPPPFELCAKNKLYSSEVIAVHLGTKSSAVSVIGPYTKRWLRLRPTTQECLRSTKSIQLFPCALSHSSGILRGLRLVQLAGVRVNVPTRVSYQRVPRRLRSDIR